MESDHTKSLEIAARLRDSVNAIHKMANDVAEARQVREFAADRRKNLLAKYMRPYLEKDISATKAEWLARSEPDFIQATLQQENQFAVCEKVLAAYDAEKCRCDAARSLLSFSKIVMDNLQG